MSWWPLRKPIPREPVPHCNHNGQFAIHGFNRLGYGICLDCHQEVSLDILFNSLIQRVEASLSRLNMAITALENRK